MEFLKCSALTLSLIFLSGCSHVSYLVQAGLGQLSLYNHERPLQEAINDPSTPEKVRERLKWVPEIKHMVETELGVKPTSNYTTYVALDRKFVIWSLTVAEPYEVKIKEWSFPFFGSFPYLGFFKEKKAEEWASEYREKKFDTYVRGVGAYSTLGFLRDPMLSSMLYRSKADMVNLIFHESTHGQIYIKGQVALNEQIASYIGDYSEKQYLERTFGKSSKEVLEWESDRSDRRRFGQMLHVFSEKLKNAFAALRESPESEKKSQKEKLYAEFDADLAKEPWKGKGMARASSLVTNNAALLAFLTYEDEQPLFDELNHVCGENLRAALVYLKEFEKQWDQAQSKSRPEKAQDMLRQRLASVACTSN